MYVYTDDIQESSKLLIRKSNNSFGLNVRFTVYFCTKVIRESGKLWKKIVQNIE